MLELLMNLAQPNTSGLPDDYSISLLGPDLSSHPKRDKGQVQKPFFRLPLVHSQPLDLRFSSLYGI